MPSKLTEGWQTRVQVEAVVESPQGIVNYGKTNIEGPLGTDSLAALDGHQFHLERITVPAGTYNVSSYPSGPKWSRDV